MEPSSAPARALSRAQPVPLPQILAATPAADDIPGMTNPYTHKCKRWLLVLVATVVITAGVFLWAPAVVGLALLGADFVAAVMFGYGTYRESLYRRGREQLHEASLHTP